ncbi:alpha/beta fold hydrolase [Mycolicibacterium litorale]|uniref:Hydrolase n=1 Tax=Mycolicibacterium litorale TaxID=758802 RepID=A0AAD1MVN3_9MYCO|nr:alpha/beta hydrolase [Mycolicibacterium litorale]MCV7416409.1 alpha/beta hydrolase [Mycolicibacterium litorale]TDY09663.1 pimeloyl-ACP methyl ester carboxylesterase [Mycolicibacterium litorale]BBY17607.1 hydrolase [Mycolicibacterium litorale]
MQVREGKAPSGDLQIHYEDMGNPGDPAVLLIMGLGAQLLFWREEFCRKLVDQGLRVIRYDNRDVGLSSHFDGQRTRGSQIGNMVRSVLGVKSPSVYTLEDMADDAAALLDHLGIDQAHIVGGSMGGMIAQIFAARHAERTKTLAVIFSSNNQPFLPPPGPRQLLAVITGPSPNSPREVIIENSIRVSKIIGSPGYPSTDDKLRADAVAFYDRAFYPQGIARQFNAITGSGSLLRYNKQTKVPTVVIHGKADKLMRPSGGKAIAKAIPNARLVLFDGMGHELPEPLWDDVVGELKTTFAERP